MDLFILSRIQFAITMMFHYIYPPVSIGLGLVILIMESIYMITQKPLYHKMTKFWVKMLGLNFAIGVATGIVMELSSSTNWMRERISRSIFFKDTLEIVSYVKESFLSALIS